MFDKPKALIKKLRKSGFVKNTFVLFSGTALGQMIPVLISPVLSRLYSPEDFGLLGLYITAATIFSVLATGRYDKAVMLPEKDEDSVNLVALSVLLSIVISLGSLIIVWLFNDLICSALNNEQFSTWLYFLPLSILFLGIYNSFNNWGNRQKLYKRLALSRLLKGGATGTTNLSVGFINPGPFGLIGGYIIGHFTNACYLFYKSVRNNLHLFSLISPQRMIQNAKRYKKFPLYMTWASWINAFSVHSPILILSFFFNSAIVGFYTFGHRILSMPVSLISTSVGQVFYQEAAINANDERKIENLSYNLYRNLFFLAVVPAVILLVFGDLIFDFVFGDDWLMAGKYAQTLSIWMLFIFVTSPLKNLMNVLEKQQKDLVFNVITVILRFAALIAGAVIFRDDFIAVLLFGIVSTLSLFIYCLYILSLVKVNVIKIVRFTILYLFLFSAVFYGIRMIMNV